MNSFLVCFANAVVAAAAIVVFFASFALAQTRTSHSTCSGLEGNWSGRATRPPTQVTFRMIAGGSALMSEIHGHGPENMITMFTWMATPLDEPHTAELGNQRA